MSAFFMLSGVVLSLNHSSEDLTSSDSYMRFIKRRFLSIYPAYLTLYALYIIINAIMHTNSLSIREHFAILPTELTLIQSIFSGSFGTLHNGGTWFISCIFMCYLLFPMINKLIFSLAKRQLLFLSLLIYALLSYSPLIVSYFHYQSIYDNSFFRILEFTLGTVIGRLFFLLEARKRSGGEATAILLSATMSIVLFVSVSLIKHLGGVGDFQLYNFITIPCFFIIFLFGMQIKWRPFVLFFTSRPIKMLSKLSYEFFLGQFFTWNIFKKLLEVFGLELNNFFSFLTTLAITSLWTLVIHYLATLLRMVIIRLGKKR